MCRGEDSNLITVCLRGFAGLVVTGVSSFSGIYRTIKTNINCTVPVHCQWLHRSINGTLGDKLYMHLCLASQERENQMRKKKRKIC